MADQDDSLLREVKEEIRRERMEQLWQRYNGLLIAAVALIILGVAGYKYLEKRRIAAAETAGADYAAAQNLSDDKKKTEAEEAFKKIAASGSHGYAALAKLQLAGELAKAGKTDEAVAAFDSLAKASGSDNLLKSFAQLQASSLRLPDADYAEMQNRLTPLAGDDAPFSTSARELLGIAAYKAKKYDEARKYLEPLLIDPNSPQALQDRVKVVLGDIATAEVAGKATPSAAATPATEAPAAAAPAVSASPAASGTTTGGTAAETDAKPKTDTNAGSEKK
jgi:hypothetical protein